MKTDGPAKIKEVKLPKVSQIGIVVPDIGKAVRYYSEFLNIKPWFLSKTKSNDASFRGESFSLELDIALAFSGGLEIELIQMLTDRECIYSDIMKKQGGGLHHIGAMVRDFDRKLEQMKAAGIGVIQSGVIRTVGGAVTKYAYMDTVSTCGIISEIIESKLAGIPVYHNNFMMHVARLTGDVDLIN
ncbi:MAG: methylmalonyl-CoA/ethylmalonyl-CoA epimerase [Thermodesulfobacteriota bacterium]|nr:methylmalonyl-CoA/ethylmalonyl-CoA epimerase [Thermodesulfobacteriota bacterium]